MNDKTPAKLHPLGNRLLVEELPTDKTSQGGIYLPESARFDRPRLFRVLQVGSKPVEPKVGQRVICHHILQNPEPVGENRYIINEEQVLLML